MVKEMQTGADPTERPGNAVIAQLVIAAALGLVALPSILGTTVGSVAAPPDVSRPEPLIWLGIALVLAIWLGAIAPRLTWMLASVLSSVSWIAPEDEDKAGPRFSSRVFAATLVAAGYVGLVEAIVRRPLVAVVGVFAVPSDVDAVVAAFALALLLAILLRLYLAARPLIEVGAMHALDAVATTSSSEATTRFYDLADTSSATVATTAPAPIRRAADTEKTVAAKIPASDDATVIASTSGEATVIAPSGDATRIAPNPPMGPRKT